MVSNFANFSERALISQKNQSVLETGASAVNGNYYVAAGRHALHSTGTDACRFASSGGRLCPQSAAAVIRLTAQKSLRMQVWGFPWIVKHLVSKISEIPDIPKT
jgi:hypothetical protein